MIHVGDCLEVMRGMADNSVDAIVTDPPYGLSFMGKRWDCDVPSTDIWEQCLRVLKPGGHLLAFAGTRTQHRMAVRIEDAGFEIRDMIAWVYGSGFPKSHNGPWGGTALKPSLEPITVARKPLTGTVAANWTAHGTGAMNIDACRVASSESTVRARTESDLGRLNDDGWRPTPGLNGSDNGRWPANLIHDGSEEVLAAFPAAPGQKADLSDDGESARFSTVYNGGALPRGSDASSNAANHGAVGFKMRPGARRLDSGSAARFFYCAKPSKAEREEGLEAFASGHAGMVSNTSGQHMTRRDEQYQVALRANHHPTVKPTDLMRYLCRLVTPAGGLVLDPFAGSGSTGRAAIAEGFQFVGIELDPEYAAIAEARCRAVQPGLSFGDVA